MTQLANQIASSRPPVKSYTRLRSITSISILEAAQGQGSSYNGLAALFGEPKDQLAFSIFSLLPWLCLHYTHTAFTPLAQSCILVSHVEMATPDLGLLKLPLGVSFSSYQTNVIE